LHALNDRYAHFLSQVRQQGKNSFKMAIEFQEIVADDPQLPFSLLPKGWKGNDAFKAYTKMYK
jgi:DNA-binding transcriptional regulator PaaX